MKKINFFLFLYLIFFNTLFSSEINTEETKPKTVFITGGCGFIGSNFVEYMFNKYPNYKFVILDSLSYAGSLSNIPEHILKSDRFKFIHGSILDYALVDGVMRTSDFVVHFAAETHVTKSLHDDSIFFETNVLGTRNMLASLVKNCDTVNKFIHISTSEVYGTAESNPMKENHPLNPRTPYAASKAGADRLVYAFGCTYNVPVIIIRPFNNYGPKQHPEKMIPNFIISAILNKPLLIHGDGKQTRDWINTFDVCRALDKVLHLPEFVNIAQQEINIGTGHATSVLEIARFILKYFNLSEETHLKFVENRPGQVANHISSLKKAKKLLRWKPIIKLNIGLKKTIEWYINNPSFWKNQYKEEEIHF